MSQLIKRRKMETNQNNWICQPLLDALWFRLMQEDFLMNHHVKTKEWFRFVYSIVSLCKITKTHFESAEKIFVNLIPKLTAMAHFPSLSSAIFKELPRKYYVNTLKHSFLKHVDLHCILQRLQNFCKKQEFNMTFAGGMSAFLHYTHWKAENKRDKRWKPKDIDIFIGVRENVCENETQQKKYMNYLKKLIDDVSKVHEMKFTGIVYQPDAEHEYHRNADYLIRQISNMDILSTAYKNELTKLVYDHSKHNSNPTQKKIIKGTWRIHSTCEFNIIWTSVSDRCLTSSSSLASNSSYTNWILDGFDMAQCAVATIAIPTYPFWNFIASKESFDALQSKKIILRPLVFQDPFQGLRTLLRIIKYQYYGFTS